MFPPCIALYLPLIWARAHPLLASGTPHALAAQQGHRQHARWSAPKQVAGCVQVHEDANPCSQHISGRTRFSHVTPTSGAWDHANQGGLPTLQGEASRAVGAHRLNAASSRSHALLTLVVDMPATASSSPTTARVLIPCKKARLRGCVVVATHTNTIACLLAPTRLLCLPDVPIKSHSSMAAMLRVFSA